ncbi:MAG TPA: hypothetical protein VHS76_14820 [Steroidobacteraceae bacterium]|jgi:uncharacterized membrane protein YphA (DoxX/SURF4 family)|nr:hypothetical protein [Steroidobacteraceae bacterium]
MTPKAASDHRILGISLNLGSMTIRQYLKRRNDRHATLAVAFLLVVGVLMGYAPRILAIRIAFAVLVGVVIAAAFWNLFEIPCPNCGKSMGSTGFWVSLGSKSAARCPHCDISVDIAVPKKETGK